MSDLSYQLESENKSGKNDLIVCIISSSKRALTKENVLVCASTSSERKALEILVKKGSMGRCSVPPDRSFEVLKLLATTGRVFYQGKKVVVDPFSSLEVYFEGRREGAERAQFSACWKLGAQSGSLQQCDWVFVAAPSWILKEGVIRAVLGSWPRAASLSSFTLEGRSLFQFLEEADIEWKTEAVSTLIEPLPFLVLTDRHGGFANLWMDYGPFGKIAVHELCVTTFRNKETEKGWEKDLLETDFIKKIVDSSHFYCPLDKVAKSVTFLLEMGWTVLDANGRKVLRRGRGALDVDFFAQKILVRAKMHYGAHEVDIKDLVGAFNRREHFVELSPKEVALIDHQEFHAEWGDLVDQEVTSEGIALRTNQVGLLSSFLDRDTLPLREEVREKIARLARSAPDEVVCPGRDFQGELFVYQKEGLQWLKFLDDGGFGGLLADEMGLGKTVQVLAFFSHIQIQSPCLIVVPTSLLFNWQREFEKFLPTLSVYRHEGKERLSSLEQLQQKQIILTSYALLRIDSALLQEVNYQVVVLDEAQTIKNPDSQISKCCSQLKCEMRLAITGTPIENCFGDLWSIFRFLQPDLLGERAQFQAEVPNAHSLAKIKKKIRPFLLRRTKQHVAIDLPPRLEQTIFVEMGEEQRCIYDRWLQNTQRGLLKKVSLDGAASHRMEILEAILRLRQLCAHPWLVEERQGEDPQEMSAKFERLISDLQEIVSERQKVLVYSQFTSMLKLIEQEVKKQGWKYVYLDGSTKNREETVRRFQEEEEVAIFLISLKAGGVGLNLTAASYVFLYDPWWNEAAERQAIDRAHRLGNVGTVIARRYVTALSIEEKIMHLKRRKVALLGQLLESDEGFDPTSLDDLLTLLT
jgi:SNF2-related domain/Helicase conserved C-terminal domain